MERRYGIGGFAAVKDSAPRALISMSNKVRVLSFLFLGSVVVLFPGIDKVTGVTAKDEYFFIYGAAVSMVERNEWIVPHLEGSPRVEKPPLVTWLTGASFEVLGVSLTSGRLVSVLFSALFVLAVALVGSEYRQNFDYGVAAAVIALSTVGLSVQGRFLMLDIPAAAFGAMAFYCFLKWFNGSAVAWLMAAAVLLACGFMTKGPSGLVLFGSGVAALVLTSTKTKSLAYQQRKALCLAVLVFLAFSIPWYIYVFWEYPTYTSTALQREWVNRQVGHLTVLPIAAAAGIFLPWTFFLFGFFSRVHSASVNQANPPVRRTRRFLGLWAGLGLVPFFFLKFSERYIMGSLLPMSLLGALAFGTNSPRKILVGSRLGALAISLVVFSGVGFSWWFRTSTMELVLVVIFYALFVATWWQTRNVLPMAISGALLWTAFFGFLYPTFGANALPTPIVELAQGKDVLLYRELQPAFLPVVLGRSLQRIDRIESRYLLHPRECLWIFVTEKHRPALEQDIKAAGLNFEEFDSYRTLGQIEVVAKSALRGETRDRWTVAFRTRSLEPVKETIFLYRVHPGSACETT